ncbi:hypothetical protein ACFVUW_28675 [Streptomyces xiamenensis]|uniref:hypothetical protein n=1 Tax=Streptomyces xiamenensis TaxID=408015 RepID=UPI0036ECF5C6
MHDNSSDPLSPNSTGPRPTPRDSIASNELSELAVRARAAYTAFTEHIHVVHLRDDPGEALEAWAMRALDLSRATADAISAHARRAHELGRITAAELADQVATLEETHAGNQEIVRRGRAEAAQARVQFDGDGAL